MSLKRVSARVFVVVALLAGASCARIEPSEPLQRIDLLPSDGASFPTIGQSLTWPRFLLPLGEKTYLWVEGNRLFRIRWEAGGTSEVTEVLLDTAGLDRLVVASASNDGRLAFLDEAGHGIVMSTFGRALQRFKVQPEGTPLAMTFTAEGLSVLVQGDPDRAKAVQLFGLDGKRKGGWGEITAEAAVQPHLAGGGIAACPGGGFFYSYIHSRWIWRLPDSPADESLQLKTDGLLIRAPTARTLRTAQAEAQISGSIAPLVQLGLASRRVMSLFCTSQGLLVRQIAEPGKGSVIEVTDPAKEHQLGSFSVGSDMLIAVSGEWLAFLVRGSESGRIGLQLRRLVMMPAEPGG